MSGLLGISPSHKVHTQLYTYCLFSVEHSSFRHMHGLLSHLLQVIAEILPTYWDHPCSPIKICTHRLHCIPSLPFIFFIVISRIIAPYYISSFLVSSMRGKTFSICGAAGWMDGWWMNGWIEWWMNRWTDGVVGDKELFFFMVQDLCQHSI